MNKLLLSTITTFVLAIPLTVSAGDMKAMSGADANNDGASNMQNAKTAPDSGNYQSPAEEFTKLDTDGDGELDRNEANQRIALGRNFSKVANGSDGISKQDYVAWANKNPQKNTSNSNTASDGVIEPKGGMNSSQNRGLN